MKLDKFMINNPAKKYYFDNPETWEKLRVHSLTGEINFLKETLSEHKIKLGKKILDVGCGTGMHCNELFKIGYTTYGLDLNQNMISYAKKQYKESKFSVANMNDIAKAKFNSKFDTILCLCTTFAYNIDIKEILKVLKGFHKNLNKNGILIIEVFNPISFLEKNKFENSFFLENKQGYNDIGLDVEVKHTVNEVEQTIHETKMIYSLEHRELLKQDETNYRLWFPKEIKYVLEENGFKVIEQFGRYDRNYTNLDKTRLITVARKVK